MNLGKKMEGIILSPPLVCGAKECVVAECKFRCGKCRRVHYCSVSHQKMAWPDHKKMCVSHINIESAGAYPEENVFDLHRLARIRLAPVSAEEMEELGDKIHLVLKSVRPVDPRRSEIGLRTSVVDKVAFVEQFSALTSDVFASWDPSLWANVLVAGGSVLASILPPDPRYRYLSPPPEANFFDYNFTASSQGRISPDLRDQSVGNYMAKVRWPAGDIDLFLYGLDSTEAADAKLHRVLAELRKTIKTQCGVAHDVVFTKTDNTVTVIAGPNRRVIQVITRIYFSKNDILNSFDLDCCCVGYDGDRVHITERGITAVRTKINVVNLAIRGDAYEHRLIKYAERGFGIGVPGLQHSLAQIDQKWIKIPAVDTTIDGDGWGKWSDSAGLERLLMCEHLVKVLGGVLYKPFPKRRRHIVQVQQEDPSELEYKMMINPNEAGANLDTYPTTKSSGAKVFAATSNLATLGLDASKGEATATNKFRVQWRMGNMPRKPLTFDEWSKTAFVGSARSSGGYDSSAWEAQREARERDRLDKERARKEQELADEAKAREERAAELNAIKREAETRAQQTIKKEREKSALDKAKTEAMAKATLAEAEQMRAGAMKATSDAEKAIAAAQSDGSGEHKCVVCWIEAKTILFEPCMHLCLCETCFGSCHWKGVECPMCRTKIEKCVKLFL